MKAQNLSGKKYGYLTVLKEDKPYFTPSGRRKHMWLCQCVCGNTTTVYGGKLIEGRIKSCGCKHYSPRNKFNEIQEDGSTLILLAGNKKILIDREDLDKIYPHRVYFCGKYARCLIEGKVILLHRIIMGNPEGLVIDHINHNTLDNRKSNLRIVTYRENALNKSPYSNTGEYGISLQKNGSYSISISGIIKTTRKTLEEALEVRNKAIAGTELKTLNYFL